jgi:hypothetical protein
MLQPDMDVLCEHNSCVNSVHTMAGMPDIVGSVCYRAASGSP